MKQLEEKHQAYDRLKGTMGNMEMKMTSQLTEAQENVLKREEENRGIMPCHYTKASLVCALCAAKYL